jgi:TatD DNase family protein
MHFVDTHCHIQSSAELGGEGGEAITRNMWAKIGHPTGDELIARAEKYAVKELICVGCSLSDSLLAVDFVQERPQCYASIGIHPHEAKDYVAPGLDPADLRPDADDTLELVLDELKTTAFAALADEPKVIAVGECGLDYFYEHSDPVSQQKILRFQIELALEHDLPLIFHVREAFDDFWPIFDELQSGSKKIRGVLHSFTDSLEQMERAVARGLYIGVNGIATFSKHKKQLEMYQKIPLSRILLETDSPFLTPNPYRGTICEPYHISVTAEFIAHLRKISLSDLAAATTANAHNLFNLS